MIVCFLFVCILALFVGWLFVYLFVYLFISLLFFYVRSTSWRNLT